MIFCVFSNVFLGLFEECFDVFGVLGFDREVI